MNTIDVIIFGAATLFCLMQFLGIYRILKTARTSTQMPSIKSLLTALFVVIAGLLALIIKYSLESKNVFPMLTVVGVGILEMILIRHFVDLRISEESREHRLRAQEKELKERMLARPENISRQIQAFTNTRRKIFEFTGAAIRNNESLDDLMQTVATLLMTEISADGCIIAPFDSFNDVLAVKAYVGEFPPLYTLPSDLPKTFEGMKTHFSATEFKLDDSLFGRIAKEGKPVLMTYADDELSGISNGSESFLQIGTVMIFPLVHGSSVLGVVAFSRKREKQTFSAQEFDTASVLISNTANALDLFFELEEDRESLAIANETEIATKIQKLLLPKRLKKINSLKSSVYFAQAQGVCSDYYDIVQVQSKRLFFVLLDVAGKSIQAGIAMVMVRSILYLVANTRQSITTIIEWLNRGITGKVDLDNYASLSIVEYNPGQNKLHYISAGRQSILIWRAKSKKIEEHRQNHDPIGVDAHSKFKAETFAFEKNDLLILYSDGVIEALNKRGRPFGLNALKDIIRENNSLSAQDLTKVIEENVETFIGNTIRHDDHTVLVVKHTG